MKQDLGQIRRPASMRTAPLTTQKSGPPWLLLLGLAGAGAAVFFYLRKRKAK